MNTELTGDSLLDALDGTSKLLPAQLKSKCECPPSHHQPRGGRVPDASPPLQVVPAGTVAILPPYLITAALPVPGLVSRATRSVVIAWHLPSTQNVYKCAHIGAMKIGCYSLGWLVPNPGSTPHQLLRDSWVVSHAGHQDAAQS